MATFTFMKSQRGKDKIVFEGYIYKLDRERGAKSYWLCHLPDCTGRIIKDSDDIKTTKPHNHSPDSASIEVRLFVILCTYISIRIGLSVFGLFPLL